MDNQPNSIVSLLESEDYLDNIQGLEEAILFNEKIVELALNALDKAEDKLFIVERIFNMLYYFLSKLETAFKNSTDENTKRYLAEILYANNVGNYEGFLLEFASNSKNMSDSYPVLVKLASKKNLKAKSIIESWIQRLEQSNEKTQLSVQYLSDLKRLLEKYV